jgi:hypothetical protein
VKVWVVSAECGLNGHSVIAVSSSPISQDEADRYTNQLVPGAGYPWRQVTGFGGFDITEMEVDA